MKDGNVPNPNNIHPITGYDKEIYIKPMVKNPNIIVGDFSYIADSEFESHVTNYYPSEIEKSMYNDTSRQRGVLRYNDFMLRVHNCNEKAEEANQCDKTQSIESENSQKTATGTSSTRLRILQSRSPLKLQSFSSASNGPTRSMTACDNAF